MEVRMKTIHKSIEIKDDIIRIPELKEFKGKNVEITITEKTKNRNRKHHMEDFFKFAGKIDIDEDVIHTLRETSKI